MAYLPDNGSVAAWLQSNNASVFTVQKAGSILAVSGSFTPAANQSVSGTVNVGNFPANQSVSGAITAPAGSIMAVSATQPAGSLLTAIQLAGSVMAVSGTFTPAANQSVSGAITAPPGSILSVTMPAGSTVAVLATQVTSPWIVAPNNSSLFSLQPAGSVLNVSISGSVATVGTAVANQSVSGAITAPPGSVMTTAQLAGSLLGVTVRSGSVISNAPAGSIMAVTVVSGSTLSFAPAGSVMTVATLAGSIMAVSGATTTTAGSIISATAPAGSTMAVLATQVTTPWAVVNVGSIISLPIGSIITIQQANSIVGTYAEDTASGTGDKGVFVLGVRNDAIASLVSADLDYGAYAQDSAGRQIIKPFVSEDATIISYVGSTVSGSVQLIQASAIGKKNYITDFWLSNTGAATTLVTFQDGTTSIMGQFIAPTGGGMASPGLNIPLKQVVAAGSDLAFKVSPSTSVLYVVVKGYQAP